MPGQRSRRGRTSSSVPGSIHHPAEVGQNGGALGAGLEVRLERGPVAGRQLVVQILRQPFHPAIAHGLSPFYRSRCRRKASRARCSWDLDVPVANPSISAISSCR